MGKYLVLSDVHLGQTGADRQGQYSLLSQAQAASRPAARALADRLQVFSGAGAEPVTLIAVGDLLDLSLSYMYDALDDLRQLLLLLAPVRRLLWIIGNHDHHIWSLHSEERRCLSRLRAGQLPAPGGVYERTRNAEPLSILPELQLGDSRAVKIDIAYPTLDLELRDGGRQVPFHFVHGHLFGGVYTALSRIFNGNGSEGGNRAGRPYAEVAATINGPLVEALFWLLGEAGGGIGADGLLEGLYVDLQRGDASAAGRLLRHAMENLFPDGVIDGVPDRWEWDQLTALALGAIRRAVKDENALARSSDRYAAVEVTRAGLREWVRQVGLDPRRGHYLVHGHTHIADQYQWSAAPPLTMTSWNLGSWLVEPTHPQPEPQVLWIDEGPAGLQVRYERIG